jgi:beta-galactosidase
LGHDEAPDVRVREYNGAPTLFVNGEPHTGLMFWHSQLRQAQRDLKGFTEAGVNLYSVGMDSGILPDGSFDHCRTDEAVEMILRANPRALILSRLSVNPPGWWLDRHATERMVHINPLTGATMQDSGATVSFASEIWRSEFSENVAACIRYCEERWGPQFLGYQIAAGRFGEWSYSWEGALSDFSEAQRTAYRKWLRRRYHDDVAELREAWKNADLDFETVEVPADRTRSMYQQSILDPACERRLIDYQEYHSWVVEDAILDFCRTAKSALRSANRQKIIGVFYGYYFWDVGIPSNIHNSGHHSLTRILESADIDFLCAPYSYLERHAGGIHVSQMVTGSVRLHGKLFYTEDDTRTHLSVVEAAYGRCLDRRTTIGVLKRNLLGSVGAGGTHWWMDLYGGGWYLDSGLMNTIAALRGLSESLIEEDRTPSAEIAVVVSKKSFSYFRQDESLTDAAIGRQISEIAHSGIPFDTYLAEDLPLLLSKPWSGTYRMMIFLNTVYLSEDERQAIEAVAKRESRTLLWLYASGLAGENGLDTQGMGGLTGLTIVMGDPQFGETAYPLMVETSLTGTRIAYGAGGRIGPILYGADHRADILGWLIHPNLPGLLCRDFGTWISVWSAVPNLPSPLIRALARRAGIHVYSDSGDQVLSGGGVLAVHAAGDGNREVRLLSPSRVSDALTGNLIEDGKDRILLSMLRGDTALLRIEPASKNTCAPT